MSKPNYTLLALGAAALLATAKPAPAQQFMEDYVPLAKSERSVSRMPSLKERVAYIKQRQQARAAEAKVRKIIVSSPALLEGMVTSPTVRETANDSQGYLNMHEATDFSTGWGLAIGSTPVSTSSTGPQGYVVDPANEYGVEPTKRTTAERLGAWPEREKPQSDGDKALERLLNDGPEDTTPAEVIRRHLAGKE